MNVKDQFPIFKYHKDLVYLDNAATTQKPQQVIDRIKKFYEQENSNVYRGMYELSNNATELVDQVRNKLAKLINAESKEIVFVSNATFGLNLIANGLYKSGIVNNKSIVLSSELEHHSSIIPWQELGLKIEYLKLKEDFTFDLDNTPLKVDVIAINLASNVTGAITNIKELRAKYPNAIIIADATQAIGHFLIDVKDLGVDFIATSAHKFYGPTGTGFIWGKKDLLNKFPPLIFGGGMTQTVTKDKRVWKSIPTRLEAGTPAIAEIIGMGAAADFLQEIGYNKISKHEKELKEYLVNKLEEVGGIKILHSKKEDSIAVVSFYHEKIHAHDIADLLGNKNIAVRAGQHCVQMAHSDIWKIPASTRISLGIYNTFEDIDKLIDEIKNIKIIFNA